MYNWTPYVTTELISLGPYMILVILTLRRYFQKSFIHDLYFGLSWASLFWMGFFNMLAKLFLSPILLTMGYFALIGSIVFNLLTIDAISQDHINHGRIILVLLFFSIMCLNLKEMIIIIEKNGYELITLNFSNFLMVAGIILIVYTGSVCARVYIDLVRNSPSELKKYSRLYLSGFATIGLISPLIGSILENFIIGATAYINTIAAILMGFAYFKEPRIFFVLPFKVHRLYVLQADSGIMLYSHAWKSNAKFVDPDLFSGMIQGVRMIIKESVNGGDVSEIIMAQAHLIIVSEENYPLIFVLTTTKTSQFLRRSLQSFAMSFKLKFGELAKISTDASKYNDADHFIDEHFPYVPFYD